MNGRKNGVVFLLAALLITLVFSTGNAIAGGPHGRFGHDPLLRLMVKLDLTDAQKTSLANILKQNEDSARNIATGLATARAQLAKDTLKGSDPAVIAADCQNVAQYETQAAQLRAQIVAQMIPTLSADQKATLQKIQDKLGTHIDTAIDKRFDHLDKWIARHQ